jgi:hypothetical protein
MGLIVTLAPFLAAIFVLDGCDGNHDAMRLYDDLLKKSGYNKLVRPVLNDSQPVRVKFGLKFASLNDVVYGKLFIPTHILHVSFSSG